jgi:O-antigen/teichoic acid export membrane protein
VPSAVLAIKQNTFWNLLGLIFPVVVSIASIPVLLANLGLERFGLLGAIWALIGYAGMLDLGLPRALTHGVALERSAGRDSEAAALSVNGIACLGLVGAFFGLLLSMSAATIASWINVESGLESELEVTLIICGLAVPLVLANAALVGALEAYGRFDCSNLCRSLTGLVAVGGAAVVSIYREELWVAVCVLAVSRTITIVVALKFLSGIDARAINPSAIAVGSMLAFAKRARWLTASSLLGLGLAYGDRLALLVLVPPASLAWYVTPYDLVTKLLIVAGAAGGALFPAFTSVASDSTVRRGLYVRSVSMVTLILFPLVVAAMVVAKPGLAIWIDETFASNSYRIAHVLCVGVLANGIATVPFAFLQGIGRARTIVVLHVVETPFYLLGLAMGAAMHGALGVAWVWTSRMIFDMLMLLVIAGRASSRRNDPSPAMS